MLSSQQTPMPAIQGRVVCILLLRKRSVILSPLLHWHWGNCSIILVPMKHPEMIWENKLAEYPEEGICIFYYTHFAIKLQSFRITYILPWCSLKIFISKKNNKLSKLLIVNIQFADVLSLQGLVDGNGRSFDVIYLQVISTPGAGGY